MKVLAFCAVGAILLTLGFTWSFRNSRTLAQDVPGVVNETEAFAVESLTAGENSGRSMRYVLKLKNVSAKKITAYVIQYPSGNAMSEDFMPMGGGIAPVRSRQLKYMTPRNWLLQINPRRSPSSWLCLKTAAVRGISTSTNL